MQTENVYFLAYENFQQLIDALIASGYDCVGPQVQNNSIVYESLSDAQQLPWGIQDVQSPGKYQLIQTKEKKAFGFSNSQQAIKPLLFKPEETVWRVERDKNNKIVFQAYDSNDKAVAILGAKACDLAAMAIQDKVFLEGGYVNPRYKKRRDNLFVVAANCSYASANCFCVSAGTGPKVTQLYDLLLTEIDNGFLLSIGSDKGKAVAKKLSLITATEGQIADSEAVSQQAADMQTKRIAFDNSEKLRDVLFDNLEHPQWNEVATRCLSCGNCTQVCPTCFCHTTEENPALDGSSSEHNQVWDSCFTTGHSYLNGKVIREDTRKRYRQWLTHKVGSWFDQFGESGCVGCGRCVSWCPVGIDLTEEIAVIVGDKDDTTQ